MISSLQILQILSLTGQDFFIFEALNRTIYEIPNRGTGQYRPRVRTDQT